MIAGKAAILACLLNHQTLPAANFAALGGGTADAAPALQQALDAAKPGDVLVLPPGRYAVGASLVLRANHVTLAGDNATLVALTPDQQTLQIAGDGDVLFGVDFGGVGTKRLGGNSSTKIEVTGQHDLVAGNHIIGGASAGIFVYGAAGFAIIGNDVDATLADGIHMTDGAKDGVVTGNIVRGNGDDMIAVVSYAAQTGTDSDISITGNNLSGNYWGRGISVVGGRNVTIRGNTIADVGQSAAIYLAEEEGRYHTQNVRNVLVADNRISNVETANSFLPPAKHPAIYLFTWQGSVRDVAFTSNHVNGAKFGGFQADGNICGVTAQGNTFTNTGGPIMALNWRDCALNIFQHCVTNDIATVKKCPGDAGSVTGSDYTGLNLWNCNAAAGHW